nr:peptidoglycan DD-metalloendopeptidase family protein [uncultured Tyzzerella sp.]
MAKENAKKSLSNRKNIEILNNKNTKNIKLKSPKIENGRFKNSNIKLDKKTIKKKNFKRQLKANTVVNSKENIENTVNILIEKNKNEHKINNIINSTLTNNKDEFKNSNINTLGSSNNIKNNKKSSINLKTEVISKKSDNNLQNKSTNNTTKNKKLYKNKQNKIYKEKNSKEQVKNTLEDINIFTNEKLNELEQEKNKPNDNNVKISKNKKYQRLKSKEDKNIDGINVENLNIDLKNASIEQKQIKYRFKQQKIYNRLKKKDTIKVGIERTPIYNEEKDSYDYIKKKLVVKKQKEVRYDKSVPTRLKNYTVDLARYKIRQKFRENEEDNSSVKASNKIGFFIERQVVNRLRSKNERRFLKYQRLDKKVENLEHKKTLNNLKKEYKNDKTTYKKAYKNLRQQKKLNRKMQRKAFKKANLIKAKNFLALTKIGTNIINALLSFKAIIISIVVGLFLGLIGFIIAIIILFTSVGGGIGNIYEIQKAELYYRELEAKAEFYDNKYIDHDPIHLASFLTCLFGEFVFDESIQSFLDELMQRQYDGKSLDQLVSDSLTKEQYEMWQQLNATKLNLIKYGSPFQEEYESRITSYIGYRVNPTSSTPELQLHKGLDIGMAGGTPILAISDGTVTRANFSSSYGNIVEIRHEDGYLSKYAHQQKLNVVKGQKVKKGDVIGFVGTTGDSTGNHLHLELYDENGEFMNPIFVIERGGNTENE